MSRIQLQFVDVSQVEIELFIVKGYTVIDPIINFDCKSSCLRSRFLLRSFRLFNSYLFNPLLSVIVADMLIE
jgi:hypothetical protein